MACESDYHMFLSRDYITVGVDCRPASRSVTCDNVQLSEPGSWRGQQSLTSHNNAHCDVTVGIIIIVVTRRLALGHEL